MSKKKLSTMEKMNLYTKLTGMNKKDVDFLSTIVADYGFELVADTLAQLAQQESDNFAESWPTRSYNLHLISESFWRIAHTKPQE